MATQRNRFRSRDTATEAVAGIDTDGSGQFTHTFGGLRSISGPEAVDASAAGGYVINCVSVSGNQATFEVRNGGGADTELALVTGGSGVTDVHLRAEGE